MYLFINKKLYLIIVDSKQIFSNWLLDENITSQYYKPQDQTRNFEICKRKIRKKLNLHRHLLFDT